jgi:hypothetical protein
VLEASEMPIFGDFIPMLYRCPYFPQKLHIFPTFLVAKGVQMSCGLTGFGDILKRLVFGKRQAVFARHCQTKITAATVHPQAHVAELADALDSGFHFWRFHQIAFLCLMNYNHIDSID